MQTVSSAGPAHSCVPFCSNTVTKAHLAGSQELGAGAGDQLQQHGGRQRHTWEAARNWLLVPGWHTSCITADVRHAAISRGSSLAARPSSVSRKTTACSTSAACVLLWYGHVVLHPQMLFGRREELSRLGTMCPCLARAVSEGSVCECLLWYRHVALHPPPRWSCHSHHSAGAAIVNTALELQ